MRSWRYSLCRSSALSWQEAVTLTGMWKCQLEKAGQNWDIWVGNYKSYRKTGKSSLAREGRGNQLQLPHSSPTDRALGAFVDETLPWKESVMHPWSESQDWGSAGTCLRGQNTAHSAGKPGSGGFYLLPTTVLLLKSQAELRLRWHSHPHRPLSTLKKFHLLYFYECEQLLTFILYIPNLFGPE